MINPLIPITLDKDNLSAIHINVYRFSYITFLGLNARRLSNYYNDRSLSFIFNVIESQEPEDTIDVILQK